jgi:Phosphotransferase enzyme family
MEPCDPYPWLEGERISSFLGRVVIKCPAEDGRGLVAKKVRHHSDQLESEAYMLKYATEVAGVKAPKLHRVYVERTATLMVTAYDEGVSLDTVWDTLNDANKTAIKGELQQELRLMRKCTGSIIGRVNSKGASDTTITFPDPCHPSLKATCAAFANEGEFDAHKVEEVQKEDPGAAVELQQRIQQLSEGYTQNFVLTHGDLNARNIQVVMASKDDTTEPFWQLSNILDWECSGFFPEYMEYAIARISLSHDPEWQQFLSELMVDMNIHCSEERVAVEYMARDRF